MAPSSRIKVMIRLRPSSDLSSTQKDSLTAGNARRNPGPHATPGLDLPSHRLSIDTVSNTISATPPANLNSTNPGGAPVTFQFDRILPPSTTNSSLYTLAALPLIQSALAGYNATLLTYGQTGAGKTYTTFGPPAGGGYKERGICARAVQGVFDVAASMFPDTHSEGHMGVAVKISVVEIYNEHIYDLLAFSADAESVNVTSTQPNQTSGLLGGPNNPINATVPTLSLFESASSGPQIRGLKIVPIRNAEEGLNLLFESQMNRAIAEHQLNDASSRSHCLFTFHFVVQDAQRKVIQSKLNIVDLAGSERMKKTEAAGQVQRESSYINKSLSFLEQVVVALASKVRDHIPYRQSKLTHVLKDSLGGNCNTLMIACVWPHGDHMDQTVSTLKFAARMQIIKNKPTVNETKTTGEGSAKLVRMVKLLKEELKMHDIMCGRTGVNYDPPTADDDKRIRSQISAFVENEERMPDITSISHVQAVFLEMRKMILAGGNSHSTMMISPRAPEPVTPREARPLPVAMHPLFDSSKVQQVTTPAKPVVESPKRSPPQSKSPAPVAADNNSYTPPSKQRPPQHPQQRQHFEDVELDGRASPAPAIQPFITPAKINQKGELERFVAGPGAVQNKALENAKKRVREKKATIKELTNDINYQKDRIDYLMAKLQSGDPGETASGHPSSPTSPRADDPTKQLKLSKKMYRSKMEDLREMKNELKFETHQKEQCLQGLLAAFEVWSKLGETNSSIGRGGGSPYIEVGDNSYFAGGGDDAHGDNGSPTSPGHDAGEEMYARSHSNAASRVDDRAKNDRINGLNKSGEWSKNLSSRFN
jgi:kinesin family protein 6/9